MKTKQTGFTAKDYDFLRQNRDIMSNEDFASFFKCSTLEISTQFAEMECRVDWDVSTGEYEAIRWLNRFERAHQWEFVGLGDCLKSCAQYCINIEKRFGVEVAQ